MLLLLALLAIGLGIAAQGARQRAERHRAEAEGLMTYMLGEFVDRLRPLGRLDLLDSVSTRALGYLAAADRGQGSAVELTQRAKALQLIAEVKQARADPAAARQALESARAILLLQAGELPRDRAVLTNLGANAFYLGQLRYEENDLAGAERYFREYRDASDRVAALAPDDPAAWIEQAYAANSLGTVAMKRGDLAAAAPEFARSVALKSRALASKPDDATLQADLADSVSWLATVRERLGELAQAASLYERQEALLQALHQAKPGDGLWSHRYALALFRKGELLMAMGRDKAAMAALTQAHTLLQQLVRQDPSNRAWQEDWAGVQVRLAELAPSYAAAIAQLRDATASIDALVALEPKKVYLAALGAEARTVAARAHGRAGRLDDAHAVLAPALERLQAIDSATEDVLIRQVSGWLVSAELHRAARDRAAAHAACERARALLTPVVGSSRDYRLLSGWVLSQNCLGTPGQARVQQAALAAMGYRASTYLASLQFASPTVSQP
ncbi:hypothetical protein [Pseudoduganella armeniaca]|uniref:Tetratricopeptide repeat protein n=1 Tax=Pseudoduganella armeniaca TaxID=2072590 RepID=A0A2R4CD05_9BURK|nr:hypothetical protein [Pseudoduganella armeniaca]AVR97360.1 hypothetical protein C9I28_18215 [Pseudoduganella armeniaca]